MSASFLSHLPSSCRHSTLAMSVGLLVAIVAYAYPFETLDSIRHVLDEDLSDISAVRILAAGARAVAPALPIAVPRSASPTHFLFFAVQAASAATLAPFSASWRRRTNTPTPRPCRRASAL